jgi:hypothetical protein
MVVDDRTRLIAGSGFLTFPVFLSKTNSYNKYPTIIAARGTFAHIGSDFATKECLSPFLDPNLRSLRGSTRKHLILIARNLPLFALFGPPDCL